MSELLGIARFTFHEGGVEDFKGVSEQRMEIVRAQDTGTLDYTIYFNQDESEAVESSSGTGIPRRSPNIWRTSGMS